jgi:hypothetical protein
MSGRLDRALLLLGAGLLTVSVASAGLTATSAASAAETAGSARTVSGTGPFADLKVTVSRTTNLRNEVVQVSWTGGRPTQGNFGVDYLQIMQCWGDAATGPDREQCQFGGLTGDTRGGAQVASRQVTYDIVDPLEPLRPTQERPLRFVPFRSVTGKTTEAGLSEFFDATTTNEVPFAATRGDGGGVVPFEVQTSVEAPGLGCGNVRSTAGAPAAVTGADTGTVTVAATGAPRSCWLVVVPRGNVEVDGSTRTASSTNQLLSSPLSESNWRQRLVVPLTFAPVGEPCPIGAAERPVLGQESVSEAVASWQPALCADGGPIFSFAQVPDAVARRQSLGDAAGLSITTRTPAKEEVPEGRTRVVAPVSLSGLTVAFNIESQSAFSAPAEVKARDGQRVTELNLTPRLVAKLLTQSYRSGAANPDRPGLEKNPLDLTRDPDFLRANPAFAALRFVGIPTILVPAGLSDAGGLLFQWLLADPEAKAFLAGRPDPDGMVVNPAYKGLSQQDGFPKSDTVCQTFLTSQPPLCTLDAFPYAGDGHEAARAAARGDTLSRSIYDPSLVPAAYRKTVPQPTGQRAVLALTDTATAVRFGLETARLRNASGAFVAPTDAALLAGLGAMKQQPDGARTPDPTTKAPGAYPLALLSHATTTLEALGAEARKEYAGFLRYAAGPGQTPGTEVGQLPPGYAPLPQPLRAQTLAAAARIAVAPATPPNASAAEDDSGAPASGGSTTEEGLATDGGFVPGAPFAQDAPAPLEPGPVGGDLAAALPPVAPAPVQAPAPAAPLALAGRTPTETAGAVRYALPLVLAAGGLAALAGSALRQASTRRLVRLRR